MNKISNLKKEIIELEKQKKNAEEQIKQIGIQKSEAYKNIALAYQQFYTDKTSKEFVLYDRFPSMYSLEIYLKNISRDHPLAEYGVFNAKELAEIFKHLYQFHTNKEHKIMTVGLVEDTGDRDTYSITPHLLFLIGNNDILKKYEELDGKFTENDRLYSKIYLDKRKLGLTEIELNRDYRNSVNIECLPSSYDKKNQINYYSKECDSFMPCGFDINKNVFSYNIISTLEHSRVKGIKDVFDFSFHHMDTYLARVLMSIIIYKKNNNIEELSTDDYNHIFGVLYGEKVDIKNDAEKDFGKSLIYVPNKSVKKFNNIF